MKKAPADEVRRGKRRRPENQTGLQTGDVLAFYALESEVFKDYLFRNCYFERPATSRKHGNYGTVYKENGEWFIRLNFQIRYRVG